MRTVSLQDFCIALYCAYTPADEFTVNRDGHIACTAQVIESSHTGLYRVEFDSVRDLTWSSNASDRAAASDPGYQLEFSVIELEREADGWRVWINPWYLHDIEFRCAGIRLNGAEVVGEGRWLQDDLPPRGSGSQVKTRRVV